jgi:bacillithiol biosynthesis cysteine-adding enzyme BshC
LSAIPGFNRLVADYLAGKPALRHLYKYDFNIDSFAQIITDKAADHTDRELLVRVLTKQYESIAMSDATRRNIDSLMSKSTFTITAAHQPCVLLGPAFNIYKISSAINLALQLKARYPDQHFVPVFWMGSEDHDFEELGSTHIYGKKIEWPARQGEAGAYGRRKTEGFGAILDEALAIAGEPARPLMEKLRDGLSTFSTFGAYTRYLVDVLFAETGLVVIDQDDAELKKVFAPIILDELQKSPSIKAVEENIKWLSEHYTAQATPRDINLFYLSNNSRERILKTEKDYTVNNTNLKFSHSELENLATTQPELFSPNVILRPVYQELVLPNLAFVGGAGELSYWLELKPVFDYHRVNYPMLVMRTSITVITPAIHKKLDKLGLTVLDFFGDIERLISDFVKSKLSADVVFDTEKSSMAALFDSIGEKAEKVDPTLKGAVQAEKQKQINALDALEGKILKAEKRKQEESINQIRTLHQAIMPTGSWQERIENFIPFYIRDADYISGVVAVTDPFTRAMLVIDQS